MPPETSTNAAGPCRPHLLRKVQGGVGGGGVGSATVVRACEVEIVSLPSQLETRSLPSAPSKEAGRRGSRAEPESEEEKPRSEEVGRLAFFVFLGVSFCFCVRQRRCSRTPQRMLSDMLRRPRGKGPADPFAFFRHVLLSSAALSVLCMDRAS